MSTSSIDADDIRAAQRALWDRFASGWEKWDRVVDSVHGPVGAAMIAALGIRSDQRHLDVASGTGEPGLTIAGIAAHGRVTLTDIAPEMLAAAERRATLLELTNVEVRECSADLLPFDDATFDSVSCRFGLMFVPDLDEVVAELVRVLRPGGRLCAAVWAEPAANPWATIPAAAIAAEVDVPPARPDAPGMFRCSARGAMVALFLRAGLRDVEEWDVPTAIVTESPEQYWQLLTELTAPVVDTLQRVDAATRQRIADAVIADAATYASGEVVRIPGKARCVIGTK
jgi:ubiquinone/menaquinone biosynthesis C-methylase UbiE